MRALPLGLLVVLLLAGRAAAEDEEPRAVSFANSPGMITIVWEHSGEDVYGWVVERQGPPYGEADVVVVATLNEPTRQFSDSFLEPATAYNHRACAVRESDRICSAWAQATTMPAESRRRPERSRAEPPPPPPLSTPVLRARATSNRNVLLEWDWNPADRLTRMALYRDGQFVFDGAIAGNFTASHVDVTPRFNTEYAYALCFSNPEEKDKCSEPVTVMPEPVPPTAPADVRLAVSQTGGGSALGGAVARKPRAVLDVWWRNTDVPGQFVVLEALDPGVAGDEILGGAARSARVAGWIEAARVIAKDDPTSLRADLPRAIVAADGSLKTYRVCALVPKLGDAGKVCSASVGLP